MYSILYSLKKHKYNDIMMKMRSTYSRGSANGWLIATVCLAVLSVGLISLSVWLYINYSDQKNNVDGKINDAVIEAKKEEGDKREAAFRIAEKLPNREFVGPEDYGLVTFSYPKTWSVYVAKDASRGGNFEAYLNPGTVLSVSATQHYALRVSIEERDYDKVIDSYSGLVKKGDLKVSSLSVNSNNGTRLDGLFSKDFRGAAAIFKIRDKTLIIRTDASTFIDSKDFDNIIASIHINK